MPHDTYTQIKLTADIAYTLSYLFMTIFYKYTHCKTLMLLLPDSLNMLNNGSFSDCHKSLPVFGFLYMWKYARNQTKPWFAKSIKSRCVLIQCLPFSFTKLVYSHLIKLLLYQEKKIKPQLQIWPWNLENSRSRQQTKVTMERTHQDLSTSEVWKSYWPWCRYSEVKANYTFDLETWNIQGQGHRQRSRTNYCTFCVSRMELRTDG